MQLEFYIYEKNVRANALKTVHICLVMVTKRQNTFFCTMVVKGLNDNYNYDEILIILILYYSQQNQSV